MTDDDLEEEPLHNPYFHLDLTEEEMVSMSYLAFQFTTRRDISWGHPPGLTISTNRFAHGADVHVALEQAQAFRDALSRALAEVGLE